MSATVCSLRGGLPAPPPRRPCDPTASSSSGESGRAVVPRPRGAIPPPPSSPSPRSVKQFANTMQASTPPLARPHSAPKSPRSAGLHSLSHQSLDLRTNPPPPPPRRRRRDSRPLRQRHDGSHSRSDGKLLTTTTQQQAGTPRGRPVVPRSKSMGNIDSSKTQGSGVSRRSRTSSHGKRRETHTPVQDDRTPPSRARSTPASRFGEKKMGLEPMERTEPVPSICWDNEAANVSIGSEAHRTNKTDKADSAKLDNNKVDNNKEDKAQATPEQLEQYKQLYEAMMRETEKGDAKWEGLGDCDDDDDGGDKHKDHDNVKRGQGRGRSSEQRRRRTFDASSGRSSPKGRGRSNGTRRPSAATAPASGDKRSSDARKGGSRSRSSSGSRRSRDRSHSSSHMSTPRDRERSLSSGRRLSTEGAMVLRKNSRRATGDETSDPGENIVEWKPPPRTRSSEGGILRSSSRSRSRGRSQGRRPQSVEPSSDIAGGNGNDSDTRKDGNAAADSAKEKRGLFHRIKKLAGKVRHTLGGGISAGSMHKYKVGERARYRIYRIPESLADDVDRETGTVEVEIVEVHVDAVLADPYYTIKLPNGNRKQTNWLKLTPLSWHNKSSRDATNAVNTHRRHSPVRSRSISRDSSRQRERSRSNGSGHRRSSSHSRRTDDASCKSASSSYSTTAQRARRPRGPSPGHPQHSHGIDDRRVRSRSGARSTPGPSRHRSRSRGTDDGSVGSVSSSAYSIKLARAGPPPSSPSSPGRDPMQPREDGNRRPRSRSNAGSGAPIGRHRSNSAHRKSPEPTGDGTDRERHHSSVPVLTNSHPSGNDAKQRHSFRNEDFKRQSCEF